MKAQTNLFNNTVPEYNDLLQKIDAKCNFLDMSEFATEKNNNMSEVESIEKENVLGVLENQYRDAYVEKKELEAKMKEIEDRLSVLKSKLVEQCDFQDTENSYFSLKSSTRKGAINTRKLEDAFPGIMIDSFRNAPSNFWTLKLKVV